MIVMHFHGVVILQQKTRINANILRRQEEQEQ